MSIIVAYNPDVTAMTQCERVTQLETEEVVARLESQEWMLYYERTLKAPVALFITKVINTEDNEPFYVLDILDGTGHLVNLMESQVYQHSIYAKSLSEILEVVPVDLNKFVLVNKERCEATNDLVRQRKLITND